MGDIFTNVGDAVVADEVWEQIIPMRDQVLIRPDQPKQQTSSGIVLPDSVVVPRIRGRILAMSSLIEFTYDAHNIPPDARFRVLDRVIFHWGSGLPTDFSRDLPNVLVPIGNLFAKIKERKPHDSD